MSPLPDAEVCYRAMQGRDARFDGWFIVGVTSTGIYCRPSCPARTPRRANVRFFSTAAAAQGAGFRACMRCRPDAAPGSPEWDVRSDLVARAMRMIGDGVVERDGVSGLARRLGYTERHLTRVVQAELGAGPLAIARARRAQTARLLIETTSLPFASVAFAAGFASIRQFNETVREVFALSPTELRARGRRGDDQGPGAVALRLAHRRPHDARGALDFLAMRAVRGLEAADGGDAAYRRVLRLPNGFGRVTLAPGDGHVAATLALDDLRDLGAAVARCRRLLDLDADPVAIDDALRPRPGPRAAGRRPPRLAPAGIGRRLRDRGPRGRRPAGVGRRRVHRARPDRRRARSAARPPGRRRAHDRVPLARGDRRGARRGAADAVGAPARPAWPRGGRRRRRALPRARGRPGGDARAPGGAARRRALDRRLRDPADARRSGRVPADRPGRPPRAARLGLPADPAGLAAHAERWRPWRGYALMHLWTTELGETT